MNTNPLQIDSPDLCQQCTPHVFGWMTGIVLVRRSKQHKWHFLQPHISMTRCGRHWEHWKESVHA